MDTEVDGKWLKERGEGEKRGCWREGEKEIGVEG